MKNITILEKFTLCMLKEKTGFSTQSYRCHFAIGMILEMYLQGSLDIVNENEGKIFKFDSRIKIVIKDKEPKEEYNKLLYAYIKEELNNKELSITDIIYKLCYSLTDKKLNELIECIKEKMVSDNLITIERKEGKIIKRNIVKVNEEKFNKVINDVRNEILHKEQVSDEMLLLISLFRHNYILNNMFNKYEKVELKEKRKEIEKTEICQYVSIARNLIESMDTSYM